MTDIAKRIRGLIAGCDPANPLFSEAADEIERLRAALNQCLQNDNTKYKHHEPRPFDGLTPDVDGGTIWKTPFEIAGEALFDKTEDALPGPLARAALGK